jgi:RHS repeat-associated protein
MQKFPRSGAILALFSLTALVHTGAAQNIGTALVSGAPQVNSGTIDGTVQQMTGANVTLNGGAVVTGDLLVPGTPTLIKNGQYTFGGVIVGTGSASPSNYQVVLNGNVRLGHLRTRTNPVTIPALPPVPSPAGTRTVTITAAGQNVGSFTTLRNLTLNGNVGQYTIPPGTYGDFIANGGSGFTLGVAGGTQPAIYNLQHLTLNGAAKILVLGPVVINVGSAFAANGTAGTSANPAWLKMNVVTGGFTVNGGCTIYGYITAPNGTVIINGAAKLIGGSASAGLTVNGNGLLQLFDVQSFENHPPIVTITNPAANTVFNAATPITLIANATDTDGTVSKVEFFAGTTKLGEATSSPWTYLWQNAGAGSYQLTAIATDNQGAKTTSPVVAIRINAPPTVAITSPLDQAVAQPGNPIVLTANASDSDGTIAKVEFFADTTKLGEDSSAPYSFTWTGAAARSYSLAAKATDSSGVVVTSAAVRLRVNALPSVTLTSPGQNATFAVGDTVAIVATASDADDGIAKVEFFAGTSKIGETVTSPHTFAWTGEAEGENVLTARATDGSGGITTSASITIAVHRRNYAPSVSAGPDQTISLPATARISGTATDDGLPAGSTLSVSWTKISGPGIVTLQAPASPVTRVGFSSPGIYVLRLTGTDSELSTSDDVTVIVNPENHPPVVNAGSDQTIALPEIAALHGTVTDDGNPAGQPLTIDWSLVAGPGPVTFSTEHAADTSVSFTAAGTYILKLAASDTELAKSDNIVITVMPPNNAPIASGGGNKSIEVPDTLQLNGTATDDGLPAGAQLAIGWTKVSGPGDVTFGNSTQAATTARFGATGSYVLRLTVSDSELTSVDDVLVSVTPRSNRAPVVEAGSDQVLSLYNTAHLHGQVTDDGLPNGTVLTSWTKVSGPGNVIFSDASATSTIAIFTEIGVYILRLTGTDSALTAFDEITVAANFANQPPVVNAGPDQTGDTQTPITLSGRVTDDGLPAGTSLTLTWSKVSGPGAVTFANAQSAATSATFSDVGAYVLQLSANDSQLTTNDQVTVQVGIPCTRRAPGLVGWWKGDNDARNAAGENDGVFVGDVGFAPGEVSDAFSVNGGTGVRVPASPRLDVGASDGLTIELWINPQNASPLQPLVEWRNDSAFGPQLWLSAGGQGTLFANVVDTNGTYHILSSALGLITSGVFQHVALTYDKTTGLGVLYRDGQMVAQQNLGLFTPQTGVDLYFGQRSGFFFAGVLDEISVYQRALRPDEIQSAYQAGSGGKCVDAINHPPTAHAGPGQTIPVSYSLQLQGSTSDDGHPASNGISSTWTIVSGPGEASFADGSLLTTNVTFSSPGTYVLRLTATDSDLTASSDVTITALPDDQIVPSTVAITPYQAADWHYKIYPYGSVPPEVVSIAFDDSDYLVGRGAFGAGGFCAVQSTVHTTWPISTEIVLRRTIDLPLHVTNVRVSGTVDNDVQVLINGTDASGGFIAHEGCAQLDDTRINVVTTSLLPGPNLFVVRGRDRGGDSFLDLQLLIDQPITADAGPDATVTGGSLVTLDGSHSAAFSGSPLRFQWAQIGGPAVSLDVSNPVHPQFVAPSRSTNTILTFRLFVNDGRVTSAQDTVVLTVLASAINNLAPVVDAGPDQTLQSSTANLQGTVQDDGLPFPSVINAQWNTVSGPGTVTFANPAAVATSAAFTRPGTYALRFSANDSELTGSDDVVITVPASVNLPPSVNAGQNQSVVLPQAVILSAQGSDDGLPNGTLVSRWTRLSGPAPVTFGNEFALSTTANFALPGTYVLRLIASDSALTTRGDVTVTVLQAGNQPPTANAGPDQVISVHASATLNGSGDDDGLPAGILFFQWMVLSGPGNVTLTNANGVISASFGDPGNYVLRFRVNDSQLTATDDVVITVYGDNQAPIVSAGGNQSVRSGNSAPLHGTVTDDGLPLGSSVTVTWSKVSGPGDVIFANANVPATSATFDQPGTYVLQLGASDGTLIASSTTTVAVTSAANIPPSVNITSPINGSNALANHPLTITAHASDSDGTVTNVAFHVNGSLVGEGSPPFQFAWTGGAAGTYSLTAVATDNEGASTASEAVSLQVVNNSPAQLVVEMQSPSEGDTLTAPTAIVGTVDTPILQSYILQYRLKDQACTQWVTFHTGYNSVTNASLGTFDTTLLRNGIYEIQLLATDLNGTSYAVQNNVIVDGNMKVGHFTVAFNDLQLPLAGLPITVSRTYDSRETCSGDFGLGWNLDVNSVHLQKNFALGDMWFADVQPPPDGNPFVVPIYSILDDGPHVITITFPDGKTYRFRPILRLRSNGQPLSRPFVPYSVYDAIAMTFEALPGTHGQLIGRGVPASLYMEDGSYQAPTRFLSVPQNFDTDFGDATGFDFVAQDGRTFTFNEQGKLTKMADRNGNTLTIAHNGIFHSSGKSIQFVRNAGDRIKQIVDPNGHTLNYQYDAHGDLLAFFDRAANPLTGSATATFFYNPGNHHLADIFDSRGIRDIRNFYDADGRLYETDDADGNQTIITHDLAGRQEIIRDRNGNTTTHHYDERGNVTLTVNAKGERTASTYHTWSDGTKSDLKETETITGLFSNGTAGLSAKSLTTHYFYEDDNAPQPLNDGLLRKLVDPLGHATSFTYNANGQVLTMKDARANEEIGSQPTVTNTYFANGNLHETTDALGNVTTYGYNVNGSRTSETRRVTVVDAQGATNLQTLVTLMEYSASGFLQKNTDASGHITTFVPDANDNRLKEVTTRTGTNGATIAMVTEHEYDEQDRLIRTWNAENPRQSATAPSSETVYNSLGKPEYVYDALRHFSHNEYDTRGNLGKVTFADGRFEETLYDKEGRREFFTDRGGKTTRYHYDVVGRLDQTVFLGTGTGAPVILSSSIFDAAGRVCSSTDANGNPTTSIYDDAGRRTATLNAKNELSRYSYDANGNQTSFTDALQHTTTYGYDALNRRASTVFPVSELDVNGALVTTATETMTVFDELGRRVREYEQSLLATPLAQRRSKRFVYDALGHLVDVVDSANQVTHYSYDELGNQLTQRDANQHTTTYGYDNVGRRLTRTLPMGQSEVNTYDVAGNLQFKKDFNGHTTEYRYDPLNRLLSKIPDPALGNPTVTYGYTATGKRDFMSDGSGTTVYHYNERDELQDKTTSVGTLSYGYNPNGSVVSIQSGNPNGVSVQYRYDALNRLDRVIDHGAGTTFYAYDPAGNLDHFTYPNGVQHVYDYDALNRLKSVGIYNTAQPSTALASYDYTIAPVGQRTSVHENTGRNVNYLYDNLHRLARETITNAPQGINGVVNYIYDPVGNRQTRTSSVTGIANQSFVYDANDRLTSDIYDNNGNTVSGTITQPPGNTPEVVSDAYDFENHLVNRNNGSVQITYDGDGNKVRETANGHTVSYLVDDRNPTGYAQVLDELTDGAVTRTYTYGHDLISQDQSIGNNWSLSFYGYDGHGNVRLLTNSAAQATDTYTYDAFGQLLQSTGSTSNDYRYSGEQLDPTLGLYYLRARYLQISCGRFWTADSHVGNGAEPRSLHKYVYGDADAVNRTDHSGRSSLTDTAVTGTIIGITALLTSPSYVNAPAPGDKTYGYDPGVELLVNIVGGQLLGRYVLGPSLEALTTAVKYSFGRAGQYLFPRVSPTVGGFTGEIVPPHVALSFESGVFFPTRTTAPRLVYRAEGNEAGKFGWWFNTEKPTSALDAEEMSNIFKYGNSAMRVSTYEIPADVQIYTGRTAGGTGEQIYIIDPQAKGVKLLSEEALSFR